MFCPAPSFPNSFFERTTSGGGTPGKLEATMYPATLPSGGGSGSAWLMSKLEFLPSLSANWPNRS